MKPETRDYLKFFAVVAACVLAALIGRWLRMGTIVPF